MAVPILSCTCDKWTLNTVNRRNTIIKTYSFNYLHSLRIQTVFTELDRHSQPSASCVPGFIVSQIRSPNIAKTKHSPFPRSVLLLL
jgi:hypothetical protein